MYEKKSEDILLATLAADSYSLGSHWVYDEEELKNLDIDWEVLNTPHVAWHEGKGKGDFTHYGDQLLILNDFLKDKNTFNVTEYMSYWKQEMKTFKGYMDGSTKDTLGNLDNNLAIPCGSSSGDMSVIGRIVPLLKVSQTSDDFLKNTRLLAQATHDNEDVVAAMYFFSKLLLEVLNGNTIQESILKLKTQAPVKIQAYIDAGYDSRLKDTFEAISTFGSSCPTESSFPSTLHILFKYDNYKEALIQNAKAGGDSSARGMIIAYLMTAQDSIEIVPKQWLTFNQH